MNIGQLAWKLYCRRPSNPIARHRNQLNSILAAAAAAADMLMDPYLIVTVNFAWPANCLFCCSIYVLNLFGKKKTETTNSRRAKSECKKKNRRRTEKRKMKRE